MERQRVLYRLEEWCPPIPKPLAGVEEAFNNCKVQSNVLLRIEHNSAEVFTKEGNWGHCSNSIQFVTKLEQINGILIIEGYRTTSASYLYSERVGSQKEGHFVFWTRWYLYPEKIETYEQE